jgi:hypothetical protein
MKLIFAANHHRRSFYFEDTISLFKDHQVVIQETGSHSPWGEFGEKTDNIHYIDREDQISYDQSMIQFKDILMQFDWDIVVFLDNDLFLIGTDYFNRTIHDFIEQGYDFCSYFENGSIDHYLYDGTIAEVKDQQFFEVSIYPGYKPVPHWENAYMYLTRDLYSRLSYEDLSNSRKMVKSIHSTGVKMGCKKTEYRAGYSHFGPEWLHMGNLMKYYYIIESGNFSQLNHSQVDKIRIGYFLAQAEKYGRHIYPQYLYQGILKAADYINKENVLYEWQQFISGTCLE